MPISEQDHGLTPLEKGIFFNYAITIFSGLKRLLFYVEQNQTIYLRVSQRKTTFQETTNI